MKKLGFGRQVVTTVEARVSSRYAGATKTGKSTLSHEFPCDG